MTPLMDVRTFPKGDFKNNIGKWLTKHNSNYIDQIQDDTNKGFQDQKPPDIRDTTASLAPSGSVMQAIFHRYAQDQRSQISSGSTWYQHHQNFLRRAEMLERWGGPGSSSQVDDALLE
jgi:hypothetical protein